MVGHLIHDRLDTRVHRNPEENHTRRSRQTWAKAWRAGWLAEVPVCGRLRRAAARKRCASDTVVRASGRCHPGMGGPQQVELCFTPTYYAWANPIETHFGPLKTFVVAGSNHPNHTVATGALRAHLRWRNAHARHRDVLAGRMAAARAHVHQESAIHHHGATGRRPVLRARRRRQRGHQGHDRRMVAAGPTRGHVADRAQLTARPQR